MFGARSRKGMVEAHALDGCTGTKAGPSYHESKGAESFDIEGLLLSLLLYLYIRISRKSQNDPRGYGAVSK